MFETHDIANADFDIVTFNGEKAGFFDAEIGFFRLDNPNVQLVQRPDAAARRARAWVCLAKRPGRSGA